MTEDDYILVTNLTALRSIENTMRHVLFMNPAEKQKFDSAQGHIYELRRLLEKQVEIKP